MIAYLILSGALLSLFYIFFLLFMRKTTFFRFNRVVLLAGSVACMLLPLVDVSAVQAAMEGNIPRIILPETIVGGKANKDSSIIDWRFIALIVYFSGAAIVFVAIAVSLIKTCIIIRTGEIMDRNSLHLTIVDKPGISFSFFNHIVICREDFENNPAILSHEIMHARFRHSLDIVLFSVITIFQWFNPVVWLTRMELKQIREY